MTLAQKFPPSELEWDTVCGTLETWSPAETSLKNPPKSPIPAAPTAVSYEHGTFALKPEAKG